MVHLCLAMMVKNEEKTLLKSLNSCKSILSSVRIFDTGSTDGTLDILNTFETENVGIKVYVKQGEFENFAVSRNILLDFVDTDPDVDFVILLDSNDEVKGCEKLLEFLEKESEKVKGEEKSCIDKNLTKEELKVKMDSHYFSAYLLRQRWFSGNGMDTYFNYRLIRPRCGWLYKAPVHEYLTNDIDPMANVITMKIEDADIFIYQDRTQDCDNTFKRFQRDKDILLKEHLKNPLDPRTPFYLAQTYGSIGMIDEAYRYYKLRIKYDGFLEEKYHSYFRLGEYAKSAGMDSHIFIQWWVKAIECLSVFPSNPDAKYIECSMPRLEPIVELATYYLFDQVNYHIAGMFTSFALTLEYPTMCTLFINRIHYDYTRYQLDGIAQYYLDNYQQGLESCRKAIAYNQQLLETVNPATRPYMEYKMQFDINNEKNYINRMEKCATILPSRETLYNYTPLELETCCIRESNLKLFFNEDKGRCELELDILNQTYENDSSKVDLLYHIAILYEKLDQLQDAYFHYKLYIDKVFEPIKEQAKYHAQEKIDLYNELKNQHIIQQADPSIVEKLSKKQIQMLNTLTEFQQKKMVELHKKQEASKKELQINIHTTYGEELYHAHLRLGDLSKHLKMDSSVCITYYIKALEFFEEPRIEALIRLATHYTFDNVRYPLANLFLQKALQLKRPKIGQFKLFINKLHYDYTRYHLDSIIQYHLRQYQQGKESCLKAISFSEYISPKCGTNNNLRNLFIQVKKKNDQANLKWYVDVLEKKITPEATSQK